MKLQLVLCINFENAIQFKSIQSVKLQIVMNQCVGLEMGTVVGRSMLLLSSIWMRWFEQ